MSKQIILASGFGALLVVVAVLWNVHDALARELWNQAQVFPEFVLMVTGDAELGMEMGRYYLGIGDNSRVYNIQKADRLFEQALQLDPNVYMGWYERAHIAFLYGNHERALSMLEEQIARTGDQVPQAYYLQGLAYGFSDNTEASLVSFQKFLELDTTDWYVHNNIAWAQFTMGNFKEAEDAALQGLAVAPGNPWLLMSAGMATYNLGDYQLALERLTKADQAATLLTSEDWLETYPKNDPKAASIGLAELQETIKTNLDLVHKAYASSSSTDI